MNILARIVYFANRSNLRVSHLLELPIAPVTEGGCWTITFTGSMVVESSGTFDCARAKRTSKHLQGQRRCYIINIGAGSDTHSPTGHEPLHAAERCCGWQPATASMSHSRVELSVAASPCLRSANRVLIVPPIRPTCTPRLN